MSKLRLYPSHRQVLHLRSTLLLQFATIFRTRYFHTIIWIHSPLTATNQQASPLPNTYTVVRLSTDFLSYIMAGRPPVLWKCHFCHASPYLVATTIRCLNTPCQHVMCKLCPKDNNIQNGCCKPIANDSVPLAPVSAVIPSHTTQWHLRTEPGFLGSFIGSDLPHSPPSTRHP